MTDQTPNLRLPYISAAQAQKHVTHNAAISALDALVQLSVVSRAVADPPADPAAGARYIVAAGATGAWAAQADRVAAWQDGAWIFYAAAEGWLAWVEDEDRLCAYDGAHWSPAGGAASLNPATLVGVNALADTTNRLAVNSPSSLFYSDGGGHRHIIDKAGIADTASVLYQVGYSGRAEMGLTGDNNLHFKVSADGTAWSDALVLNAATGTPRIPAFAVGALPSAGAAGAGAIVFASNETGGPTLAYSDGVNWRRCTDAAVVAAAIVSAAPFILFAGESNAVGNALNTSADAFELAADPAIKIFNNSTLAMESLAIGVNNGLGQGLDNTVHGWELGLEDQEAANRYGVATLYLVKSAQAGTLIGQWASGGGPTTLYNQLVARVSDALSLVNAGGAYPTPVVWYSQGINDAIAATPTDVATWKAATLDLFARFRGLLGAGTKIVFPYLPTTSLDGAHAGATAVAASYNAAIDQMAAADPLIIPVAHPTPRCATACIGIMPA